MQKGIDVSNELAGGNLSRTYTRIKSLECALQRYYYTCIQSTRGLGLYCNRIE